MAHQPFPGRTPFWNNSMQIFRIVPQPSPPRAGSKPIHTFNFMQTERFLTHRLIFGWKPLTTCRAITAKAWLKKLERRDALISLRVCME